MKVDEFIQVMERRISDLAAQGKNRDILGFQGLKVEDLDLKTLTVELAYVVGYFLPKTRWLKQARPVLGSQQRNDGEST